MFKPWVKKKTSDLIEVTFHVLQLVLKQIWFVCIYTDRVILRLVSDQRLDIHDRNKYIHCLSALVFIVKKSSALAEMDNTIFKCPQVSNMHLTV